MRALLSRWRTPAPAEFRGLALCAALYAAALTAVVWFALPARDAVTTLAAAVDVGLAVLAWVTAEAIWRMRPWAYRSAFALAGASVGVFAVPAMLALLAGSVIAGLGLLIPAAGIAFVTWPMVGYLKRAAPVPRPRP